MANGLVNVKDAPRTIDLPRRVWSRVERGMPAKFGWGQFTLTIEPKQKIDAAQLRQMSAEDDRIWKEIEPEYRRIRLRLARERYPYLFSRRHQKKTR